MVLLFGYFKKQEEVCDFILIQDTVNEDTFLTREMLSWEDGEILCLSSLFLLLFSSLYNVFCETLFPTFEWIWMLRLWASFNTMEIN